MGSNNWRSLSKFHALSDADILASIEKDAKQLRALSLDDKESFLVFTFESFERSSDMVIWTRLLENLARIGIIAPRLFQVNEESDYQVYLALDKCVKIAPIAKLFEEYLHFYGSGLVRVLTPGNHFVLPLQAGFRWMNESVQPVVARREMSTDVALNFFVTEVTKTLIDTDALIAVLDAAVEATGVREIARAFDVTQEMPESESEAPEINMEACGVDNASASPDAPQSNVVAFRFRSAPKVEIEPASSEDEESEVSEDSENSQEIEHLEEIVPPTPQLIFDPQALEVEDASPQLQPAPEELTPTLELEPVPDEEVVEAEESMDPMAGLANELKAVADQDAETTEEELESVADQDPEAAEALELEAIQSPDESVFLFSYLPPAEAQEDSEDNEDAPEKKSCDAEESTELEIAQQETILFDESADYLLPTDAAQKLSRLFNLDPLGETPRYRLEGVKEDTRYIPDDAHQEVFAVEEALESVVEALAESAAGEAETAVQLEVDIDVEIPVETVEVIEIVQAPAAVDGLEEVFEEAPVTIRYVQLQLPFAEGLIEPLVFEETPFRPRSKKQKRTAS